MDPFDPAPYPEYAHQVAALLARIAREDREAVAGSLRRMGFRIQGEPDADARHRGTRGGAPASTRKPTRGCDFRHASPISSLPRQRADMRIPHLDCENITRTSVPRSADGKTHPRYPERDSVAAGHYDYLTDGAAASYRTHFDYITRLSGPMTAADGVPAMDILDFEADHRDRNALAVLSNIPGGPARQRGLFEAAERCERQAHRGVLLVSTEHEDAWAGLAAAPDTPPWVNEAALLLQRARIADDARADRSRRKHRHRPVEIADVDLAEAYARLVWADAAFGPDSAALPQFEQGRAGRIQTRFVVELPNGLDARQHRTIMERFCARLHAEGWMYAAAIHCPDAKNDPRNVHLHVDAYDRPCRWMPGMGTDGKTGAGCWDFEVAIRKRNGDLRYPYRQQKIGVLRGGKGQNRHEVGEAYFKALRAGYIAIANDVAAGTVDATRYVTGTYRDHGIRQDRLEHLGDRIIGNEKNGLVTDSGSRNARIIFNDRLRHVRHTAVDELLALRREARLLLARANTDDARLVVRQWRQAQRLAIRKQMQATAAGIVRDMAVSRAETVIAHGKNARRIAAAKLWIAETDRAAGIAEPTAKSGKAECATEAVMFMADLLQRKAYNSIPAAARPLIYRRRGHEALEPVSVKHRDMVRGRLLAWLDEHGEEEAALTFDDGRVALGTVKKSRAIDRLFRLFIDDLLVQERLRAIQNRRLNQRTADRSATKDQAAGVHAGPDEPAGIDVDDRSIADGPHADHAGSGAGVVDFELEPVRDADTRSSAILPPPSDDAMPASDERAIPQQAETAPGAITQGEAHAESHVNQQPATDPGKVAARDSSGTNGASKLTAARREALAKSSKLREDGWAMVMSGNASIIKSGDGYTITGMPVLNRRALLQPAHADEFEKRLAALVMKQPAGGAPKSGRKPAATPHTRQPYWPFGRSPDLDWPAGPPIALRDAPALHAAVGLGRGPAIRGASKPGMRVAFASDLVPPPQGSDGATAAIAASPRDAGGKTGNIRKQAEAEAEVAQGNAMMAKSKGPGSTSTPMTPAKPVHER